MKNIYTVLIILVFVVLTVCVQPFTIKTISKPIYFCAAPYGWEACGDWAYKGLYLSWRAENDNFISVVNIEEWNMLWNGSEYDRHVRKTYMIQSSLLGDSHYGDCGGWGGICYKYSEYTDTVKP
jgi:hypothetical protein